MPRIQTYLRVRPDSSPLPSLPSFLPLLPSTTTQAQLYSQLSLPPHLLTTHPTTTIAYGATSAGKTYSLFGPLGGAGPQTGLIVQQFTDIYRSIKSHPPPLGTTANLTLTFVQVSNVTITDLLTPGTLPIHPTPTNTFTYPASHHPIPSLTSLHTLLTLATSSRTTGPNSTHAASSRTHAIATLHVILETATKTHTTAATTSHTYIDLAGSEAFTGAAGVTSNAGINTNILSFTQCLAALRNNTVPPWRDCILTKILKGLITTNTTTILGCVNFDYHHEAMNTIRVVGDAARGMCDGAPTAATTLPIIDPLNGDLLDPTPSNRRMVTIPCKTGDIVARVMGDESDPLILYVHGSGPRNSSFQFKDNMVQLAQQAEAGNVSESFDNSCSVFAERFWDDQRRGSSAADSTPCDHQLELAAFVASVSAQLATVACSCCDAAFETTPQILKCGHLLCGDCWSMGRPFGRCLCGASAKSDGGRTKAYTAIHQLRQMKPKPLPPTLVYGNTVSGTTYKIYFKAVNVSGIKSVSFNINPAYDKPTYLTKWDGKIATFEYCMKREFPCWITVKLENGRAFRIRFTVDEQGAAGRIVVESAAPGLTEFDCEEDLDGTISGTRITYGWGGPFEVRGGSANVSVDNIVFALIGETEWAPTPIDRGVITACAAGRGAELVRNAIAARNTERTVKLRRSLATPPKKFYQVAIDCPGYGRSAGDRQTIRSYPTALVREVLDCLGVRTAYCVVGSSQGSQALINACMEDSTLARSCAVKHPISMSSRVEDMKAVRCPTLLVYDDKDGGHPVKVGRMVRRVFEGSGVKFCYVEFDGDRNEDFEELHFVPLVRRMWEKAGVLAEKGDTRGVNLTKCCGGVGMFEGTYGVNGT